MAVQLSLPLPDPWPGPRRVWFLKVAAGDLAALRRALRTGVDGLVDARDGRSALSPRDLVLVRLTDDRFQAFGAPADLLGRIEADDLTTRLAEAIGRSDHRGWDLIGFCRGRRSSDSHDTRPGTPLEDLFRLLRDERHRLSQEARLRLCRRALANLGAEQALVQGVLAAQLERLARLAQARAHLDERLTSAAPRAVEAAVAGDEGVPSCEGDGFETLDLFGTATRSPTGRDLSFQAFRVQAVSAVLREADDPRPFSRLPADGLEVCLRETQIAKRLQPLTSHRLVGSVAWAQPNEALVLRVEWEVRRSLPRLVSARAPGPAMRIWLEDAHGVQASASAPVQVGDDLRLALPPRLVTTDGVSGLIAFESGTGRRARQPFLLE